MRLAIPARYHPGMDAPIQTAIPGLPPEHVKTPGGFCELCGSELPEPPKGKTGRKQRWCLTPLGGGRSSCHAIAQALQRLAAELPPERDEIRRLKRKAAHRRERGKALAPADQKRLQELMEANGPEYPEAVRRGTRSKALALLNRFNSNGWGAA